jgi:hypothetical protein
VGVCVGNFFIYHHVPFDILPSGNLFLHSESLTRLPIILLKKFGHLSSSRTISA